jgi:hypothetical protein
MGRRSPPQGVVMKDPNVLLQQKEAELARIRHEIESLRIVASLLEDDPDSIDLDQMRLATAGKLDDLHTDLAVTGTDNLFSSVLVSPSRLWTVLKRGK